MKIPFSYKNLGYAVKLLGANLGSRIPAEQIPDALKMVSGDKKLSELSREEARNLLKKISIFNSPDQIDSLLVDFEFQEKTKVSTEPDPFFKKDLSPFSVNFKMQLLSAQLDQMLEKKLSKENFPHIHNYCQKVNKPGVVATILCAYLMNELRNTSEVLLQNDVIKLLQRFSSNELNEEEYLKTFGELKKFRASLSLDDPILEKTLRLGVYQIYPFFKNNSNGTKMSLVRDPDLPTNAPYIDLASGILTMQFVNQFFSDQNQRVFYINDNAAIVHRFYELFQDELGVNFEPRVKIIDSDLQDFDQRFKNESVGTIRLSNIHSYCEESQYNDIFEKADRILMPNGKIIVCLRHIRDYNQSQPITINNFRDPRFKIKSYHTYNGADELDNLIGNLIKKAEAKGWQVKIGTTAGEDHHFEWGMSGKNYGDLQGRSTDLVFIKPNSKAT